MERNHALLLVIFVIIFLLPDTSGPPVGTEIGVEAARTRTALQALRNSTFEHLGNLTGLLPHGHTPPDVVRTRWRATRKELLSPWMVRGRGAIRLREGAPVWWNASGSVEGEWWRDEGTVGELPRTGEANASFPHNMTRVRSGKVGVRIDEGVEGGVVGGVGQVRVGVRLQGGGGGVEAELALAGVHFRDSGEIVAVSTSERFAGFFALPHFLDGEEGFNATKKLLLPVIEKALRRMEERNRLDAPWIMVDAVPKERPQCEYIVYAQIHPVAAPKDERKTPITADVLRTIETELRFPTGQTLPPTPPLQVTAMIYSPNCGFVLMAPEMRGKKAEEFNAQSSHFGLAGAAVAAAQIWLLIRQMNESNTLSTVSRVSFWTIAMMWVVDGYFFFSFLFVAMFMPASFLPMAAGSFCYLMITAQFGIRFLVATYRVQRQSRGAAAVAPPAADGGLPMQETATVIPANQPANRDDDANYDVGIMQIRFYFTLMAMLLLTLHSTTWPQVLRNLLMDFTLLLTNSYWLPQVWRNVMRGCRKAFRWEFVFGTSILRLAAVAYFYLYDDNIFKIPRNPALVGIVAGWVTVQCLLLIVQDVLGPRFLLPAASLPPVYDYHPSLGADDEEAAQDMGTRTESGGRSFDCVVCMQTVEIPRAGSEEVGLLGRRGYMVTPCKHVFHSHCLEGWMRFRLQCPICRNPLPAL